MDEADGGEGDGEAPLLDEREACFGCGERFDVGLRIDCQIAPHLSSYIAVEDVETSSPENPLIQLQPEARSSDHGQIQPEKSHQRANKQTLRTGLRSLIKTSLLSLLTASTTPILPFSLLSGPVPDTTATRSPS